MELAISISAFVISIISLLTSIYFSKKAQQHNIKSVLPIPYFDRSDFEDLLHIKIFNKGTGPIIISKIIATTPSDRGHLIDIIPQPPNNYFFTNFSKFNEPRTILPGQHNDLLVCKFDLSNEAQIEYRNNLRNFLKDVKLACVYSDVYGSKFESFKADCKWYGRHFE